jgi:hypothetical protein
MKSGGARASVIMKIVVAKTEVDKQPLQDARQVAKAEK